MNKAFVKESEQDEEEFGEEFGKELEAPSGLPPGSKNYMTTRGHAALRNELKHRVERERPDLVQVVAWAASNGDRSENGDYIYGKKRLREIDRRIRFLMKRLETAVVVDPSQQQDVEQVFFGATVTVRELGVGEVGMQQSFQIVGVDEADAGHGLISWISPLARALLKARAGDVVRFHSPAGVRDFEVVAIRYQE